MALYRVWNWKVLVGLAVLAAGFYLFSLLLQDKAPSESAVAYDRSPGGKLAVDLPESIPPLTFVEGQEQRRLIVERPGMPVELILPEVVPESLDAERLVQPVGAHFRILVRNKGDGASVVEADVESIAFMMGADEDRIIVNRHLSNGSGIVEVSIDPWTYLETCRLRVTAWKGSRFGELDASNVSPGANQTLEIVLADGATVTGFVSDSAGRPIQNVEVTVEGLSYVERVHTDVTGRYVLTRFPSNDVGHILQYRSDRHGTESATLRVNRYGEWQRPDLEESGTRQPPVIVDVVLPTQLVISGVLKTTANEVVPDAQILAEGYYISVSGVYLRDQKQGTSGSDGRFELAGLRSDIGHQLEVRKEGYAAIIVETPFETSGRYNCGTIILRPEVELAGSLVDASGHFAEGLEVRLVRLDAPGDQGGEQPPSARDARVRRAFSCVTTSGHDGRYSLSGLAAGTYRLEVLDLRRPVIKREIRLARGIHSEDIQLPVTEFTLAGSTLIGNEEEPMTTIIIEGLGGKRMVTADGQGYFRIPCVASGQSYELTAVKLHEDGSVYASAKVNVSADSSFLIMSLVPARE